MSKTAVVLGAYGLIGAACVRLLKANGYRVIGVGRSLRSGQAIDNSIEWRLCDLGNCTLSELQSAISGADVVVNAAGALQDTSKDQLEGIHVGLIDLLISALSETSVRVVQISAAGVSPIAETEFFASKARGDDVLLNSELNSVVLRPTLVIGTQAYGGTALLRAFAGFPVVGPRVFPDSPIQVVSLDDVAKAVALASDGQMSGVFEITSQDSVSFDTLVTQLRNWMGFTQWRLRITVPSVALGAAAKCADLLGRLGWRSPMRTTAISVLRDGITGDSSAWHQETGQHFSGLAEILSTMPSSPQERWFARMFLFLPMTIGVLSIFWLVSGGIGLWQLDAAKQVLISRGTSDLFAHFAVIGGAIIDISLGIGVLIRKYSRMASLAMFATCLAYLMGATLLAPDLFGDPLGAMIKVLPASLLCLIPFLFLEDR